MHHLGKTTHTHWNTSKSKLLSGQKHAPIDQTDIHLPLRIQTHTQSGFSVGYCLWACGLWTASQTPVCPNSLWEIQLSACLNYSSSNTHKERRNTCTGQRQTNTHTHTKKMGIHLTSQNPSFSGQKFLGSLSWFLPGVICPKDLPET